MASCHAETRRHSLVFDVVPVRLSVQGCLEVFMYVGNWRNSGISPIFKCFDFFFQNYSRPQTHALNAELATAKHRR